MYREIKIIQINAGFRLHAFFFQELLYYLFVGASIAFLIAEFFDEDVYLGVSFKEYESFWH